MPITINSKSCSNAGWWAKHAQKTETNERVEIIGFYGLGAETIEDAFRQMRGLAAESEAKNFFSAYNINPRADEHLTEAQWDEAHALHLKNHGLAHLPYFRVRHTKEGRVHEHGFALRVDPETAKAISDSLTAAINERTSRELEIRFGLERGHSVLTPERDEPRPERQPKHWETFRGEMSGLDPKAIGRELGSIKQRSDNGQSFRAGIEAAGYTLTQGDRRDFMVIDRAGREHSLGRRLHMKAAELRAFMKDIDRESLPTVAEGKARQLARAAEMQQRHAAAGRYDDIQPDRAAAAAQEQEKHGAAADGQGRENKPASGPQRPAPSENLSKTAGDMRMAWSLSRDADQLTEALAMRGIGTARVTAEEAYESQRNHAFAKEIGNRAPVYREGEIVAVNGFGSVYRFNEHTTGQLRDEIEKRLAGIDPAELMSIADTKEAMREADRAAYAEARERARPATAMEQRIIDCREKAEQLGAEIVPEGSELGELETVHGAAAFAGRLDQAGIAIVRVTQADEIALAALRQDQDMQRLAAETNREARRSCHFDDVKAGEIAAVDRSGNVHRLNHYRLDLEALESTLLEAGNDRLPSVTEARAAFETKRERAAERREETAEVWRGIDAENAMRRGDGAEGPSRDSGKDEGVRSEGSIASRFADGFLRGLGALASAFEAFFSPPKPPTKEELKQQIRAEEEQRPQREARAEEEAHLREILEQIRRADQRRRQERERRGDRDDDRGRERER